MEKEARKLYKKTREAVNKAKRTYVCHTLEDVIKAYRECKTLDEERALVKKESAHIRDLFKEGDTAFRRRNVLKLIFFQMNGYPTDFGHMECLKLAASSSFKDKRVGYLGLTILMDENQELLLLITNALKMDLNSNDSVVVGLALSVLANVSSAEMLRDLEPDVSRILDHRDPNLCKKAVLVADRIVRKVPDLAEVFVRKVPQLLSVGGPAGAGAGSSSVHHAACSLVIALCETNANAEFIEPLVTSCVESVVQILMFTAEKGADPDTAVQGIPNPFLQVRAIRTLRVLLATLYLRGGSANYSAMLRKVSDVLATLTARLDSTKTASTSILYEIILVCLKLEVDPSMIQLALTLLGKFLNHKENNIKYVALQELCHMVALDPAGVKQHVSTVLECLQHADISIRSRAVDLIYNMADPSNAGKLVDELLQYLVRCDAEHQSDLCLKIWALAERFESKVNSKTDIFIRMLNAADVRTPERLITNFVAMLSVSQANDQAYSVSKLYSALQEALSSAGSAVKRLGSRKASSTPGTLIIHHGALHKSRFQRVSLYVLGEYGAIWLSSDSSARVSMQQIIGLISNILDDCEKRVGVYDTRGQWSALEEEDVVASRHAGLLAAAKLAARMPGNGSQENIVLVRELLSKYRTHPDIETQQRACEYSMFLTSNMAALRAEVFKPMPKFDYENRRSKFLLEMQIDQQVGPTGSGGGGHVMKREMTGQRSQALISLLDDDGVGGGGGFTGLELDLFGSGSGNAGLGIGASSNGGDSNTSNSAFDLLGGLGPTPNSLTALPAATSSPFDLLALTDGSQTAAPAAGSRPAPPTSSGSNLLADLFGGSSGPAPTSSSMPIGGGSHASASSSSNSTGLFGDLGPSAKPTISSSSMGALSPGGRLSDASDSNWQPLLSSKEGFLAKLLCKKKGPNSIDCVARFVNSSPLASVTSFVLQIAVPKYLTLSMSSATSKDLAPKATAEQRFSIESSAVDKAYQLRFRIEYRMSSAAANETVEGTLKNLLI